MEGFWPLLWCQGFHEVAEVVRRRVPPIPTQLGFLLDDLVETLDTLLVPIELIQHLGPEQRHAILVDLRVLASLRVQAGKQLRLPAVEPKLVGNQLCDVGLDRLSRRAAAEQGKERPVA